MEASPDAWRTESDSMGEVRVPRAAYWGSQTQRAVENFGVSPLRIPVRLIRALGLVKAASAAANRELGLLPPRIADALERAAREVADGAWDAQFPIDVFQTGSGTSWNMNVNEVIANRASELLGSPLGSPRPVHPNDHANRGQSSNDVIPTAINIADRAALESLLAAVDRLHASLGAKAEEFRDVLKIGRTHLQDAVPMTLGQEFSGYARQVATARTDLAGAAAHLEELAIGGTAVGTGLNTHPGFAPRVVAAVRQATGLPFREAENRFEAMAARDAQVGLMGRLEGLAVRLTKIANDLRLLASGPRTGLGELRLPELQPGSSAMPGKINPIIPEMVLQAAAHVIGSCLAVTLAGQSGPLELNMMQPLVAYETLSSLELMERCCRALADRCIDGLSADVERARGWIEASPALVTPLALRIGYDAAAKIAHTAFAEGRSIRDVVVAEGVLGPEEADRLLDPRAMLGPRS
jgi:fumarate hydratase class II